MATAFAYQPDDYESEKASNVYLMSLVAVVVGLPLPIVNLIATGIFYLNSRKSTHFVRWHCIQALVSQMLVVVLNSTGLYWTIAVIRQLKPFDNTYIAYMLTLVLFNFMEFCVTIYTATVVRKGRHVEWWLFGPLTNLVCKS